MRWPNTGLRSIGLYGPAIPMLDTCMICSANGRCWSLRPSIVSCGNRRASPTACMDVAFALEHGGASLYQWRRFWGAGSEDMNIDLTGRAAIITGGSKGIGLAVATRFAASGADVAIVARGRVALDA